MTGLVYTAYDDFGTFEDTEMGGVDQGVPGFFAFFFVLIIVVGIATTVWKVSTARRVAQQSGMDPNDATAMALLTDNGLEATYLASNLRPRATPPTTPPAAAPATTTTADRLRELASLLDQGLITQAEHDARRQAIIDGV